MEYCRVFSNKDAFKPHRDHKQVLKFPHMKLFLNSQKFFLKSRLIPLDPEIEITPIRKG